MQEQEIHLRDYVRVVRKRKSTVLTFFSITFIVVLIGTFIATPRYQASTKMLVEKNEINPLGRYYSYTAQDPEFITTQNQIIKSRRVARKVVRLLDLEKNWSSYFPGQTSGPGFVDTILVRAKDFFTEITASASKNTAQPQQDEDTSPYSPQEEVYAKLISSSIEVKPVQESKVFDISFTSDNPVFSKKVVNTLAKAYMEELLEIKMNSSNYTIKWMTQKADVERAKLQKSEKELQDYMQANDIVTIEDKIAIIPQKMAEFSSQLSKAEARRKELESLQHQVERDRGRSAGSIETLPSIVDSKMVQSLREQVLHVDQKISELSKKYGPKHPVMIKAVAERNSLLTKKQEEVGREVGSINSEYELATANENNLRNLLTETKEEALKLNEKFIQYQVMKREVETNRALYEALLGKLKEQTVTEETQSVNVWIVEEAETPKIPAKPDKKRNLLLGLVLGLFGGIGLAFFVEYLDNTVKTPEEAEERLGVPMLGTIARIDGKLKPENSIVCLRKEATMIQESFRSLRTSVLLSSADSPPKSIVVTSMLPGEGKTTTTSNLAVTIAQAGQRVLLIDADMRKPRVHRLFKLDNRKGLSTFLVGRATPADIIQSSPQAGLYIIPSGPIPPNPSELLSSPRIGDFVQQMQTEFDIVIFDSTPVFSVTDALLVSKVTEGVIVVTRAEETTYEIVTKGVKMLQDAHAHILGMVVNGFDSKKFRYYYGSSYSKYYGKYYGEEESREG